MVSVGVNKKRHVHQPRLQNILVLLVTSKGYLDVTDDIPVE